MKIKWKVDTYATITINGKPTPLLLDGEYDVPEDEEYFQNAIARGWAEVIPEEPAKKTSKTKPTEVAE